MTSSNLTAIEVPESSGAPGLAVRTLTSERFGARLDPFIMISHFDMSASVFPPHPHAGFSVATYIFPESDIGFWNQDALGNMNEVSPGSLHLTVAGAGVMHEETVTRSGRHATGFQIWIDHADADREVPPRGLHLSADDVPVSIVEGVTRRILLGASQGVSSPINAPVTARIADVEIAAGARFEDSFAEAETGFVWLRAGVAETAVGDAQPGTVLFAETGGVSFTARTAVRATVFAGHPLRQETVPAGTFMASSQAQARVFRSRYGAGGMGRLKPFDQAALDARFDSHHRLSGGS